MLDINRHEGNNNRNHNDTPLHTYSDDLNKNKAKQKTSGNKNVEKLEPSHIAGRDVKQWSHYGKLFSNSSKT